MKWHFVFLWVSLTLYCFVPSSKLFAQLSGADSSFYQSSISTAINAYHHASGDQSGLYSGSLYPGYPFHFKVGSPFFNSDLLDSGAIFYDSILYESLLLRYDNLKDAVMINDNGYEIQLNNKKIVWFTLSGHHFIHPADNDMNNGGIATGFYEVLYKGNISLLKKTIKTIQEDLSSGQVIERLIIQADYYYLKKDSVVYPVESKKDVINLLPAQKKEIQQFVKKNKLNFRGDRENALLKLMLMLNK